MAKEPASIRYKNPGAMWGSAIAIKWGAEKRAVSLKDGTGQGNNIAVFPTFVQGICAQLDLWRTSKHYRNKKFKDAIAIWSGRNHVEEYIAFVLKRVPGMTRDTVMNDAFWQSEAGVGFLKAQAWHEAGKKYPAPDADWLEAQRLVFQKSPAKTGIVTKVEDPNVKGKIIATVRTTGLSTGVGTVIAAGAKEVLGPTGETVESVKTFTDSAGEVAGSVRTVVEWVPEGAFSKVVKFVQTPGFLMTVLALVLIAWAISYWLRRNEGPK